MTNRRVTGLGELKQQAMTFPDKDKGYNCECCGQFVKRYYRKMNSNMAMVMIMLVRKKKFGFIHIEDFMRGLGFHRSGDFSYLVHWKLLEKMGGERPDGSKRNGFYKITDLGRKFVNKEVAMQQTLIIYNSKCEGFEGPFIDIEHALGKKFDYAELMKGDYTIQST